MILPIIVRRCLLGAVAERPFAPAGSRGRFNPPRSEPRTAGEKICRDGTYATVFVDRDRLQALPRREVHGLLVPVATTFRSRLLGLAGLTREQAGAGLLIPGCASVHTFAMRFDLDLIFLDRDDHELAIHHGMPPRRLAWHRAAAKVLEVPSPGGESSVGVGT